MLTDALRRCSSDELYFEWSLCFDLPSLALVNLESDLKMPPSIERFAKIVPKRCRDRVFEGRDRRPGKGFYKAPEEMPRYRCGIFLIPGDFLVFFRAALDTGRSHPKEE